MARSRGRTVPAPKARNDAYVGLLAISFLALAGGSTLLYLDYEEYGKQKAPPPPSLQPAAAPAPGGPGGGQPPVGEPPVGQPPMGQPPVGQPPMGGLGALPPEGDEPTQRT